MKITLNKQVMNLPYKGVIYSDLELHLMETWLYNNNIECGTMWSICKAIDTYYEGGITQFPKTIIKYNALGYDGQL